jgi:hypothetical protein
LYIIIYAIAIILANLVAIALFLAFGWVLLEIIVFGGLGGIF